MTRANKHARRKADVYLTPTGCVKQLFDELKRQGYDPKSILDPSAGLGVFPMCASMVFPGARIDMIEPNPHAQWSLRKHVRTHGNGSAQFTRLQRAKITRKYDLIATNPPFSQMQHFMKLVDHLTEGGVLVFLLRTDWGQSGTTADLRELAPVQNVWRLVRGRLSFTGDGATDACEYSWFFFRKGAAKSRHFFGQYLPALNKEDRRWRNILPGTEPWVATGRSFGCLNQSAA